MKNVLQRYEECSGQKINFEKSTLFFSCDSGNGTKSEIKDLFEVQATTNLEKYIGLPSMVGRNKIYAFRELRAELVQDSLVGTRGNYQSGKGSATAIKGNGSSHSYLYHGLLSLMEIFL